MVVGDSISLFVASSTDFQPAAGVEDVLNHIQGDNNNLPQFKDGVNSINIIETALTVTEGKDVRIYVTNDSFIGTIAVNNIWIHGVQVNS